MIKDKIFLFPKVILGSSSIKTCRVKCLDKPEAIKLFVDQSNLE